MPMSPAPFYIMYTTPDETDGTFSENAESGDIAGQRLPAEWDITDMPDIRCYFTKKRALAFFNNRYRCQWLPNAANRLAAIDIAVIYCFICIYGHIISKVPLLFNL